MPIYKYRAKNEEGNSITGELEAASENAVAQQLSSNKLMPILIEEVIRDITVSEFLYVNFGIGRPTAQDLIIFSRQMHTLSKAGVPLIKSITVVANSCRNENLKAALHALIEHIKAGNSLSSSMQKYPMVFSKIMVSMVNVGENTGALEEAFLQIAFYLETDSETRKRMKGATRYPSFVLMVIAIAVGVINVLVIPAFKGFFDKFGAALPLPTRILIATSDFTLHYWLYAVVGIGLVSAAVITYIRTEAGGIQWDWLVLRLPIIGPILNKATLSRFARAFSMTSKAGVPLLEALSVIAHAVGNRYITSRVMFMRSRLQQGESLIQAASSSAMFTPLVMQMIHIGEETGDIDSMLTQVAIYYEEEVDYELKKMADVIEPILIILVACMVLVLALGVFLPMWDLSSVILKKTNR